MKKENNKEEEDDDMDACAIKPGLPFVTRSELKRNPATSDARKIAEFMDSHDFSFSVDKNTKELKSTITPK